MFLTCSHVIDSPKDECSYHSSINGQVFIIDEWSKAYQSKDTAMLESIEDDLLEFFDIAIEDIGGTFVAVQYRHFGDYSPDFTGTREELKRTLWYVK